MATPYFENSEAMQGFGASLTWREQLIELTVFLLLILPSLFLGLMVSQGGGAVPFSLLAVSTIVRDLALVSLIAFFLWRNGERERRIGWTFRRAWLEIGLGLLLFIPTTVAASILASLLQSLGLSGPSPQATQMLLPHGIGDILLAVVLVAVVALAEETIFRGYLIVRLASVTQRTWVAVILSTIIFAIGHGYEGATGVISVGFMGLIFALVFVWRRSLLAPITMHFLQDFLAIVVAPLLAGR